MSSYSTVRGDYDFRASNGVNILHLESDNAGGSATIDRLHSTSVTTAALTCNTLDAAQGIYLNGVDISGNLNAANNAVLLTTNQTIAGEKHFTGQTQFLNTVDATGTSDPAVYFSGGIEVAKKMIVYGDVDLKADLVVGGTINGFSFADVAAQADSSVQVSGDQSVAGDKTFSGLTRCGRSGTGLQVDNNCNITGNLTIDGTVDTVDVGQLKTDFDALDGEAVKESGNQSIAGQKTFSDDTFCSAGLTVDGDITCSGTLKVNSVDEEGDETELTLSADTVNFKRDSGSDQLNVNLHNPESGGKLNIVAGESGSNGDYYVFSAEDSDGVLLNRFAMYHDRFIMRKNIQFEDTTDATSAGSDSAVRVDGGLSVGMKAFIGGTLTCTSTADSTNATTGAIITAGGITCAKQLRVGKDTTLTGKLEVVDATATTSSTTGSIIARGGVGIAGSVFVGGNISAGKIKAISEEDGTGINTGGLSTGGGLGIAKSAFIGENLNVVGRITHPNAYIHMTMSDFDDVTTITTAAIAVTAGGTKTVDFASGFTHSTGTITYSGAAAIYADVSINVSLRVSSAEIAAVTFFVNATAQDSFVVAQNMGANVWHNCSLTAVVRLEQDDTLRLAVKGTGNGIDYTVDNCHFRIMALTNAA
jgi:hypothetical protein